MVMPEGYRHGQPPMTYGCQEIPKSGGLMRPDQIAVQLYTVRELAAEDLPGTLEAVAQVGFGAVELAGLPSIEAPALRDLLASNGLTPVGSHESLERLRADLEGVIERMTIVGCPRIVVPWLPDAERSTTADVRRVAAELGRMAKACDDRGIRLGYHNHAFEFEPLDGTTVWDVLLESLPGTVELEIDVYWVAVAGRDPVDVIRAAGDRVRLLHMKDLAPGPDHADVTPGDGTLPWPDIIAAGTAQHAEWYVVEEDNPRDAIAEISRGGAFLRRLAETPPAAEDR
jgi:sugar phosphate isomerase/epimerase